MGWTGEGESLAVRLIGCAQSQVGQSRSSGIDPGGATAVNRIVSAHSVGKNTVRVSIYQKNLKSYKIICDLKVLLYAKSMNPPYFIEDGA
ncbi:MAG: hypothetical protein AB4426_10770 [Xenococcaceae cyanobacterium]